MGDKTLAQKLNIKSGYRGAVINSPSDYEKLLGGLPDDARLVNLTETNLDFVHLFVNNKAELDREAPKAISALKYDGLLWISYPKRSSKVETDMTRDTGWETLDTSDFRPVTQVSVNSIWSALRFRPKAEVK